MTALIVNADDLGLSPAVTHGILESHESGLVTSASLLTNLPGFGHAIASLGAHPRLGVGVHLNLTLGRPLSAGCPSLVGPDGRFHRLGSLVRRGRLGQLARREVERELGTQLERALSAGVQVTHLDSHHHAHLLVPLVWRVTRLLARDHGIPWIRFHRQRPAFVPARWHGGPPLTSGLSYLLFRLLAAGTAGGQRLVLGSPQVTGARPQEWLTRWLAARPRGLVELVCHPGHVDDELRRMDSYVEGRARETQALQAPAFREQLRGAGVRLLHYGALSPRR